MSAIELQNGTTTFPWLVFQLAENYCAVNSQNITSIQMMPEYIQRVPNTSSLLRGLFSIRGETLPLLDLRKLLDYSSLENAYREFTDMLETRKQEHLHWVEELERCITEEEPFLLATDPHKCTFGRWYYSFSSDLDSVNHLMSKIEDPHRRLHEAALAVEKCDKNHAACRREICLKEVLRQVKEQYAPLIVGLLEEAKGVFKSDFREEVFILGMDEGRIGVTVDRVISAEPLSDVTLMTDGQLFSSPYVLATGKCKNTDKTVLLLDEEKIQHCL